MSQNVYSPPQPAADAQAGRNPTPTETSFDETTFVAKRVDTTLSRAATQRKMRRVALGFFLVTSFAVIDYFRYREQPYLGAGALVSVVMFTLLGIYAYRMSRRAMLLATVWCGLIFVASLYELVTGAWTLSALVPVVVRAMLVGEMYRNYGMLCDLDELENG